MSRPRPISGLPISTVSIPTRSLWRPPSWRASTRRCWRARRRAGTRDPLLALALGPALRRSMGAMLEAASLSSEGLTGALRQNGLLAIHYAVSRAFDNDESLDLSKTMAALDNRLKMAEKWSQLFERYTASGRA